jgi:hypothetical protein
MERLFDDSCSVGHPGGRYDVASQTLCRSTSVGRFSEGSRNPRGHPTSLASGVCPPLAFGNPAYVVGISNRKSMSPKETPLVDEG